MSSRPLSPDAQGEACLKPHCAGTTSEWAIVHPVQRGDHTVIVEGVPARVCFTCGDTRISDSTRERLEALLDARPVTGTLPFREWRE